MPNKFVTSVLAGVGLMVLFGVVVFVETYRTLQGHPDGVAGPWWIGGLAAFAGVGIVVLWRRWRRSRRHSR